MPSQWEVYKAAREKAMEVPQPTEAEQKMLATPGPWLSSKHPNVDFFVSPRVGRLARSQSMMSMTLQREAANQEKLSFIGHITTGNPVRDDAYLIRTTRGDGSWASSLPVPPTTRRVKLTKAVDDMPGQRPFSLQHPCRDNGFFQSRKW
eukprot:TRINITY_DN9847_c0_g1_i1.p1 TRINITY_DN9847_c0_g1~~TRINITY_DN9847_c0_g1_i1.p1  ORF type:complete len:149 (-),score=24.23 TRINITY_DN9847_c0_g1_i1:117-563(-)